MFSIAHISICKQALPRKKLYPFYVRILLPTIGMISIAQVNISQASVTKKENVALLLTHFTTYHRHVFNCASEYLQASVTNNETVTVC